MLLWGIVRVSAPGFTVSNHVYELHQSDSSYERMQGRFARSASLARQDGSMVPPAISEPENTLTRQESWELALRAERREGLRSMVRNAIILFIDLLVFAVHWRIARGARADTT